MVANGAWVSERAIALFLDVDGTLLEIAASPDAVAMPAGLRELLGRASARETGAVALVSGRTLADLDRLFAPALLPAAGLHGNERRDAVGRIYRPAADLSLLQPLHAQLRMLLAAYPELLLEDKGAALALHYRAAPHLQPLVHEILHKLAAPLEPQFRLKPGKCVLELAPAACSKRTAIEAFMREAPFAGRTPVFIGDDVTDEDGFAAVNALGGYAIRVGRQGTSTARYRLKDVSAVIACLRERYALPGEQTTT
jgi:trehalose 6-phosphate phosphatase